MIEFTPASAGIFGKWWVLRCEGDRGSNVIAVSKLTATHSLVVGHATAWRTSQDAGTDRLTGSMRTTRGIAAELANTVADAEAIMMPATTATAASVAARR